MRDLFGFQLLDKAAAAATSKDMATASDQGLSSLAAKVGVAGGGGEGNPSEPASASLRSALR